MNTIERIMKKGTRTRLIVALILIGSVVVAGVFLNKYIINFINGPYVVEPESLENIQSVNDTDKIYITVEDVMTQDTGIYYEVDGRPESYYSRFPVGENWLIVKSSTSVRGAQPMSWTGEIVSLTGEERREVVQSVEQEFPSIRGHILPVKLTTKYDFKVGVMIGLGIATVILLIGLWYLSRWFKYTTNPETHPVMQKLRPFGDPLNVASQLEMELNAGGVQKIRSVQFTRNWLLYITQTTFNLTRYQDIVWLYQKVVSGRYGKTYYAAVNDRFGRSFLIQAKQKDVAAILQTAAQHAPWAIIGHDKDTQKLWTKQRDQMIAAVEKRKTEMTR
ncbi:MAG: hypothetical protein D6711_16170 [Chloroflexi bacterium]|nr:MAG: hypothetical protein D6711_16170 [Chloroflexota bacterium]